MISQNLNKVRSSLKDGVELVAVSKYHPVSELLEAYNAGQRIFGESHVQELVAKYDALPKDIEWHFIGHLQTNKVKYITPFISLIHAVDSMKLLKEINKQALKNGRVVNCLLQLHVAQEETKFGFTPQELVDVLAAGEWKDMTGIHIVGVMCMATNTDDDDQIHREFRLAYDTFCNVKKEFFADDDSFKELSMGMSGDYMIAQYEHSTMVRVGSMIFGNRDYSTKFTI
ncbi:MAG: YggS family pyridoxal phosphate-dependent enzyme [Bacteroidaceae bacterium]|nr:YggS family pyridoxal phosphate-dependent enzyme [Bacteroidaceae bacterium]